ncbi:beta-1,3-galactosyltransferase 1 [Tetranychus urticae]|uniref:Hexosyltransferase n=1 Tax=Tetranychus urticae TaxID=32264 RepID=T1KK88_TETUR|nr:beta-1,3-galactosyltransferase 1 [Tetranychus urticae]
MYIFSCRRRCVLIYIATFLFVVTLIAHKIYVNTRVWTDEHWHQLRPVEGLINYRHNYIMPGVTGCTGSTRLFIMVFSRPESISTRALIRTTWLNPDFIGSEANSVSYRFLLGGIHDETILAAVKNESSQFGDIIIDTSFPDSYQLLVRKTISMVDWVDTYCSSVMAVLKSDDDTWFNVEYLLKILPYLEPGIHGHVFRFAGVSRNPKDAWFIPSDLYPFGHYPDFTSGSGYLIVGRGTNIYSRLLATLSTIRTVWMEDIFLTGLVAEKAKVPRFHHDGFNSIKYPTDDICQYRKIISSHQLDEDSLYYIYLSLTDSNLKCATD